MSFSITELPYLANIQALALLFQDNNLALLDSPKSSHKDGRWSILSAAPIETVELLSHQQSADNLAKFKQQVSKLASTLTEKDSAYKNQNLPFTGGVIGIASYELGITEAGITLDLKSTPNLPIAVSRLYSWAFLWDHHQEKAYLAHHDVENGFEKDNLVAAYLSKENGKPTVFTANEFCSDWDFETYRDAINKTKRYILNGDVYQINLAQRYQADYQGNPLTGYFNVRERAASPFSAFWSTDSWSLASISPERFVQVQDGRVETKPIKGTRPNTGDATSIQNLKESEKDRAENLMIVDLLRNDISKHCNSVEVEKLFDVETYPTVHHLVSTISGQLRKDTSNLDLFWDAFPGGSITGAPKKRAMEIINELESSGRSFYCGSIFYQSTNGHFDSNILIRSFIFNEGHVTTWAGGGIVADSTAESEYQECSDKIQKLMNWLN